MTYQRDDEGINISEKNPNYSELTAMYWAWKNIGECDAIGLEHYRRFLSLAIKFSLDTILNEEQVDVLLSENDMILPKKRHYYIETNYSHYVHAHQRGPLDRTRIIIQKYYPTYLHAFDLVMQRRSAHMFNIFVMQKQPFLKYSKWLFSILGQLEKEIDVSEFDQQEARVFGYISELLLDVWVECNQIKFVEVHCYQIGPKHYFSKIVNFALRKFGMKNLKTHF